MKIEDKVSTVFGKARIISIDPKVPLVTLTILVPSDYAEAEGYKAGMSIVIHRDEIGLGAEKLP